jgi:hypothetical protein
VARLSNGSPGHRGHREFDGRNPHLLPIGERQTGEDQLAPTDNGMVDLVHVNSIPQRLARQRPNE